MDPSGLLVSQSSGLGEFHASERSVLKEKENGISRMETKVIFCPPPVHAH